MDADEVTYNLHIILRYELELALIRDELAARRAPGRMERGEWSVLGSAPEDDIKGVMQDIHWSWGEFGYFPTYALGNLYSAALAEAMSADLDIDEAARSGDYRSILDWLREKVHHRGYVVRGEDTVRKRG